MTDNIDLSPEQEEAVGDIKQWFETSSNQTYYLAGYAGTGKTTLAKIVASMINGRTLYGAFTGKAAQVLRQKGCDGASTIHSMIYKLMEVKPKKFVFAINERSAVKDAKLVIIDECSMVGEELGEDLLSFGTKVLVLGDPAQLPPVKSTGYFTNREPDYFLKEVHRQAEGNPIIKLSMDVRKGKDLDYGDYGEVQILNSIDDNELLNTNQILVGMNKTRATVNTKVRDLLGYKGDAPMVGEKLVCLKNNRKLGVLNGSLWEVTSSKPFEDQWKTKWVELGLKSTDTEAQTTVKVPLKYFTGGEADLPWAVVKYCDQFTYGYALTVHKSQGSQWDDVLLFNEASVFREDAQKWLYTGITRAAETLRIVG